MIRLERAEWRALSALLFPALLIGCGSEPDPVPATPPGGPTVEAATKGGDFNSPLDSVPTSDATTIYFVANSSMGRGIFSVAGDGGAAAAIAAGGQFVAPIGVAVGSDDQNAYVADTEGSGQGAIFVVNLKDGAVSVLNGTAGTAPTSVTVVPGATADTIYYTGETASQEPAVYSISADGASMPTLIASGAPLVHPFGIAVAADGTVYVADDQATDATTGKVFSIVDGVVKPILDSVITGNPAGIALTKDESTLLVSSVDATGHDQVVLISLPTYDTAIFNAVIGANTNGGGVHRAAGVNVFSWCDLTAGATGEGVVYRISL